VIEFAGLIFIIMMAFLIFQKYIVRGFSGRWKSIGDTFGQGRIYDPNKTIACAFDAPPKGSGIWYDQDCFVENCEDLCLGRRSSDCTVCISGCQNTKCDDS